MHDPNPFFELPYESTLAALGDAFYDRVRPAIFPKSLLRFRNDDLLPLLGLAPATIADRHFTEAFGQFKGQLIESQSERQQENHPESPPEKLQSGLALRYHGYQFGQYNPYLGDGRGFLYGQVRTVTGQLLDLGTKGSGKTPHSQGRDGRMSLLGGVREVLAAEALHRLGIPTSRVLSLIETGEDLARSDEPTRSAVMVRLSRSHIRFGTFERLDYFDRPDLIRQLLDHVIQLYYGHLWPSPDRDIQFYAELVQRTAELVAQWMAAGFCHGVLNTDNMSIVGEGFDYGPYAFIDTYSPYFTAASFDLWGRYSYRNQPSICRWNLEMLQRPLARVMPKEPMETVLESFTERYDRAYHQAMLGKLGFKDLPVEKANALIQLTLEVLFMTQIGYHRFFQELRQQFSASWREDPTAIFTDLSFLESAEQVIALKPWKALYHQLLQQQSVTAMDTIAQCLGCHTPKMELSQSAIASVWAAVEQADDWQPFSDLITAIARA
ncbi:MAG: YdiU family protein [Cyanobacteria bacterium J06635_1]